MGKQGEFSVTIGSAKHIRMVEKQIQEVILSNVHELSLVTELAEYLRSVFRVDFCLLCPQPQGSGILVTSQNCSWYSRAELLPLLGQPELLANPENPEEIVAIANLDRQVSNQVDDQARNQDQLSLPTPLPPLASLLKVNTPVGGLIILGSQQPRKFWTKGEKNLLQALVSIVAIALQQSQVEQKLSLSYSYQKLVNQITQAIRDHEEISQILQQAITATAQTLEASAGTILLLKYKEPTWKNLEAKFQGMVKTSVAAQWKTPGYQQQLLPAQPVFWLSSSPLCSQALNQAPQPLILQASPGLVMFPLLGTAGNTLSSRVLGFLVLEYDSARQLLEGELELIHSVSNQISYALIQDQTLRQVRAIVDKRTAQLQASLEVQGRLYEKIRHQVDQLRQLNQIKDEFISAISHELRTPLTSMTLAIRMLREEELPPDRQAKYLEVLAQQCQQEVLLINDLLALQQLEENSPLISLEMINLQPILQNLAQAFQQHWAAKALRLQLEVIPASPKELKNSPNTPLSKAEMHVSTHPDSLQRILAELLTNAGKYSHPETTVQLRVEQAIDSIIFKVSNEGDGIPPEEQDLIFEKFHRAQTATQKAIPGTGLGLALVKPLVKHLRGKITVASYPIDSLDSAGIKSPPTENDNQQKWITCFTVRLPQFLDGGTV